MNLKGIETGISRGNLQLQVFRYISAWTLWFCEKSVIKTFILHTNLKRHEFFLSVWLTYPKNISLCSPYINEHLLLKFLLEKYRFYNKHLLIKNANYYPTWVKNVKWRLTIHRTNEALTYSLNWKTSTRRNIKDHVGTYRQISNN